MKLKRTTALTPTLSPRRGRNLRRVGCKLMRNSQSDAPAAFEGVEREMKTSGLLKLLIALPLLGERVGVRADQILAIFIP